MSNPNQNNMFDRSKLESLDKKINDVLSRPSLVGQMKDTTKKKQTARLLDWNNEFRKYFYLYIFLIVSSIFTMTLGIYMGIAPKFDAAAMTLTYQTDIVHLFLALIYAISFVTVTEVAFVIGKWLFFTREENNTSQRISMLVMMFVAGISILGTGIAGGMVIASNISFLTSFVEIPDGAQKWVVVAIPVLITFYTFLVTIYSLSSDSAASERLMNEMKRTSDLDNITRQRAIEQVASEQLQVAELERYLQLVSEGRISAGEAKAAIRAGRTLGQEEVRQGRDIDGKGGIGNDLPQVQTMRQYSPPSVDSPEIVPIDNRKNGQNPH